MKKSIRIFASLLLVAALVCSLSTMAFADQKSLGIAIRNVNEAAFLVYNNDELAIYSATLHQPCRAPQDIYYVVCKGVDFCEKDMSQPRSLCNAIKIGLSNENNSYTTSVINAINTTVPHGSNLVFVGHSMGGMVIQQVVANCGIKKNYNVLYTLAIGSPYILTKGCKEGVVRRVVDTMDPIPYLSIPLLANPLMGSVAFQCTGKVPFVHFRSYIESHEWLIYDCLGFSHGFSYIVLNQKVY